MIIVVMIMMTIIIYNDVDSGDEDNSEVPEYMQNMVVTNSNIHQRDTRYNQFNFICPRYNKELDAGRSFTTNAIKAWNMLP